MLFFNLFTNFSNIYTEHTNEVWRFKVEKTGKCHFYAILTRNINGKQLKKLLEVVTQNLKSFSNHIRWKSTELFDPKRPI